MRYALIGPTNVIDRLDSSVDPSVQTKSGWRWLECPVVAPPAYDGLLQVLVGPTYTVGETSVIEVWVVRDRTAQELSDLKDAVIASLGAGLAPILKGFLNVHNRLRVLEGQPTQTMAQFIAALKSLL